jgi:hypothetical protein
MGTEFASADLTAGQLNAIVKRLGGHDGALKFLRGDLVVTEPLRKWSERDGVIYFSVTSNGRTGEQWIAHLLARGYSVGYNAQYALHSPNFKPTKGITTEIAVLRSELFGDRVSTYPNVREVATKKNFIEPNAEVACLIRDMFTDAELKAMGLCAIITMHKPIRTSNDGPFLFHSRRDDGGRVFMATYCESGRMQIPKSGFACAVP